MLFIAYIDTSKRMYIFLNSKVPFQKRSEKGRGGRKVERTKACIAGKIVKSQMKWAGHMVRMKNDKLPKRSETKKQGGFRKRGKPQLRWEDCVKRDLRKAEEEEKWSEKANNRDQMEMNYKSSRTSE